MFSYKWVKIILFQSDPLLCDLPTEITLEEINSQIALEYGQAMVVNVRRADGTVLRKFLVVYFSGFTKLSLDTFTSYPKI